MIEASTINKAVMTDKAYRHFFGRAVEQEERSIIRAVHSVRFHFNVVTASYLTAAVSLEMGDCSRPTARKAIQKAAKKGLLVGSKDPANERRTLYRFSADVAAKLALVDQLETEIAAVIAAQKADPMNVEAGKELLSAPIYFHIAAEGNTDRIKKALEARVQEFQSANQNNRSVEDAA